MRGGGGVSCSSGLCVREAQKPALSCSLLWNRMNPSALGLLNILTGRRRRNIPLSCPPSRDCVCVPERLKAWMCGEMSVGLGLISLSLAVFMLYVPKGYPQSQRGEEFAVAGSKSSPGVILFVSTMSN